MNSRESDACTRRLVRWKRAIALAGLGLLPAVTVLAKDSVVQCANLIYGGTHTSRCFSSEFLSAVQRETTIRTERRFKSVKLGSDELFRYPFAVITGEADFHFTRSERENLKKYVTNGGFLLASAGCSSEKFDRAFKREVQRVFGKGCLNAIPMDHPVFSTLHEIKKLKLKRASTAPKLLGLEVNGKIAMIYSHHGLNDTTHTEGCCCCGGNEILNSLDINMNILVYALLH
jgi:hypothetical protein